MVVSLGPAVSFDGKRVITKSQAPHPISLPPGDCVEMSLRGSKTTEAISQCIENKEIATLPAVARNDKKGITTQSPGGEGQGEGWFAFLEIG